MASASTFPPRRIAAGGATSSQSQTHTQAHTQSHTIADRAAIAARLNASLAQGGVFGELPPNIALWAYVRTPTHTQPANAGVVRAAGSTASGTSGAGAKEDAMSLFWGLIARDPSLVHARDELGNSPLHFCALKGDTHGVRRLLRLGAKVDATSSNLQTPLMWACVQGHVSTAELLLDYGADANARDSLGANPLLLALQHARHCAMLLLLDRGTDVAAVDSRGCTLAHWAAYKNDVEALRILRRHGANLDARDFEGLHPIHRAARGGAADALEFLLDVVGVDPRRPAAAPAAGPAAVPPRAAPVTETGDAHEIDISADAGPGTSTKRRMQRGAIGIASGPKAGATAPRVIIDDAAVPIDFVPSKDSNEKDKSRNASGKPRDSASRGERQTTGPTAPSQPTTETPLSGAEDALRIMISSAETSGGVYGTSDGKSLITRQREIVNTLRRRCEAADWAERSVIGKVVHFVKFTAWTQRGKGRALVPFLYLHMLWFVIFVWWRYMAFAAGGTMALLTAILIGATVMLHLHNYFGDTSPLDPYHALGADRWVSLWPWQVMRTRAMMLPIAANGGAREMNGRAARADAELPVFARALAALNGRSGAATPSANTTLPGFAGGSVPQTSSGEVDYAALVDMQLDGDDVAAVPEQKPAATTAVDWSVFDQVDTLLPVIETPIQQLFRHIREDVESARGALGFLADDPSVLSNGDPAWRVVTSRVCYSCELLRPWRAKHDANTDRCYDRYDHFCNWTGTPVARGNYVRFLLFVACQLMVSSLVYLCMWEHLGSDDALVAHGVVLPAHPGRLSMLFSSYWIIICAVYNGWSVFFTASLLRSHWIGMRTNVTTNEAFNMHRYRHFRSFKVGPTGLPQPTMRNPFDLGDPWENTKEALGWRASKPVTTATVISRDVTDIEEATQSMFRIVNDQLKQAKEKLREEIDKQHDVSHSHAHETGANCSDPNHDHAHEADKGARPAADAEDLSINVRPNAPLISPEAPPAGMNAITAMMLAAQVTGQQAAVSTPESMLQALPDEMPSALVRQRVIAMVATMDRTDAWEKMFGPPKKGSGGHGHSHGGGGHGHSHGGGGGGHGHSHGGDDHGHSHGGGHHGHSH